MCLLNYLHFQNSALALKSKKRSNSCIFPILQIFLLKKQRRSGASVQCAENIVLNQVSNLNQKVLLSQVLKTENTSVKKKNKTKTSVLVL